MPPKKVSTYILVSLLFFAGIGLLTGLYVGLIRMGWLSGYAPPLDPLAHGPLMINGFLGTLIGLERAAALEKKWAYAAPVFMAAAMVLTLCGLVVLSQWGIVIGAVFLLYIMGYLYYLHPEPYHLIMALGAACLLVGNVLFLFDAPIFNLVAWWVGFPLLTIFGERLELNRIMRPPENARRLFVVLAILWAGSIIGIHFNRNIGWGLASLILITQSAWLFKYDVARRTIKAKQWTRFSAICLLSGYVWLILSGLFSLWQGFPQAGPLYDALLHMIFVGFVFSMIFAHSSVIIPSLSGKLIPYHGYFYLPLILLHSFLLVRVIGDVIWMPTIRQIGSYGNVAAILLFLGGVVFQLNRTSRK